MNIIILLLLPLSLFQSNPFEVKLYDCEFGTIIQVKDGHLYYVNRSEKRQVRIKSRDLEILNNQFQNIFQKQGDEIWLNFCVDDGSNLKFNISKGDVTKKVFVGNYYDNRVDEIMQIINNYLTIMGLDSMHLFSYGPDEWTTKEELQNQNDCGIEVPIEYKERLLNEWCELEK